MVKELSLKNKICLGRESWGGGGGVHHSGHSIPPPSLPPSPSFSVAFVMGVCLFFVCLFFSSILTSASQESCTDKRLACYIDMYFKINWEYVY